MTFSSSNPSLLHRFSLRYSTSVSTLFHSLCLLWFLCFLTTSADVLHVKLWAFKVKLNNGLMALLFFYTLWVSRSLHIDRLFFRVFLFCLFSLCLSFLFGYNTISCFGFILFFIFNYFCYFQLPLQAFRQIDPSLLLRLYRASFSCVGAYAMLQVLGSLFGYAVPFAHQSISFLARGQGFSYEPSYYALYITPYATYLTMRFFMQPETGRKLGAVLLANGFLLVSTSTGCFFSYLSFLLCFALFSWLGLIPQHSLRLFLWKGVAGFFLVFVALKTLYPELISAGFLKFFYTGFKHHSFMERWNLLVEYGDVFLEHPWVGTGLGGATTYLLGKYHGAVDILDPDIISGMAPVATNVTTEILGSLGLLGALAFSYFLYAIYSTYRKTLRIASLTETERTELIAFAVSLCVLFVTLQFNGSIMRSYVWMHVGISVGYANYVQAKYKEAR